jgi:hypothetical protein
MSSSSSSRLVQRTILATEKGEVRFRITSLRYSSRSLLLRPTTPSMKSRPTLAQLRLSSSLKLNLLSKLRKIVLSTTSWTLTNSSDRSPSKAKSSECGRRVLRSTGVSQRRLLILTLNSSCKKIAHQRFYLLGPYQNNMTMTASTIYFPTSEGLAR